MKAYCIFDDYPSEAVELLEKAGIHVTVHPHGVPRPDDIQMEEIMIRNDCIIIGTSQKIRETMFGRVFSPKIIATASAGTDHIAVPSDKKHLIKIINSPAANTISVAEYVVGAMLLTRKRFFEGCELYRRGQNNKQLHRKPEELKASVVGLIGAGRISTQVIKLLQPFDVKILCNTQNPEKHSDLAADYHVDFVSLDDLARRSDIISVHVPYTETTAHLISADIISKMKEDCIFISISREEVLDSDALFIKAGRNRNFYAILDLDINSRCIPHCNGENIIITPHIAGGTIEARKRMFSDTASRIAEYVKTEIQK